MIIWSFIELNAGLICASVPTLKPFCMRYIPFLIHGGFCSQTKLSKNRYSLGHEKPKRHSSNPYSDSYEMPSREELPQDSPMDEEARLWSMIGEKNTALESVDTKQDSDSVDSVSDKLPIQQPEPALIGFTTRRTQNVGGIQVTKETIITYGPID